ncbi:MAG: hypothetical protein AAFV80_05175 [Bacteroidota bacterium]
MKHQLFLCTVLILLLSACCKTKDRTLGFERLAIRAVDNQISPDLDTLNVPFRLFVNCAYENLQSCGPLSAQVIENPILRETVSLSLNTAFEFSGMRIDSGANWLTDEILQPFLTYDTFYCFDLMIDSSFFDQADFPSGDYELRVAATAEDGSRYSIRRSFVFDL